jgi:hypothetical protein
MTMSKHDYLHQIRWFVEGRRVIEGGTDEEIAVCASAAIAEFIVALYDDNLTVQILKEMDGDHVIPT